MAFTSITITHTFLNADGTPASGTVRWSLSGRMTNSTQSIMPSGPKNVSLNGSGVMSVVLPANDDTGTTPIGVEWQVTIAVTGCSEEQYLVTVPHSAPGGTIDLGQLLPQQTQVG